MEVSTLGALCYPEFSSHTDIGLAHGPNLIIDNIGWGKSIVWSRFQVMYHQWSIMPKLQLKGDVIPQLMVSIVNFFGLSDLNVKYSSVYSFQLAGELGCLQKWLKLRLRPCLANMVSASLGTCLIGRPIFPTREQLYLASRWWYRSFR